MRSRGDELVAQSVVRWHPGCGGGSAWVRWGMQAIGDYRSSRDRSMADSVARRAEQLRASKDLRESQLLATPSLAGNELLRCAIHFIGHQRHRPVQLADVIGDDTQMAAMLGHASMWARAVADLIEALYQLPGDVVELVRCAAAARKWRLPEALNVERAADLVDTVEARLGLEDAIESGAWTRVYGSSLAVPEARAAAESLIRIARQPNARAGRDIAFKAIAYDFNRAALDGLELELSAIGIHHVPAPDSSLRAQVRDRMIGVIDAHLAGSASGRPAPTAAAAAHVLAGIGDDIAVARIIDWLTDHPREASRLFPAELLESLDYEINPRGRRRDVVLGYTIPLAAAPPPLSPARRDTIEVFRPIGGRCRACGSRLVALFDVLVDPARHRGLPAARRVFVPMCPNCCDDTDGYSSRVRMDDREAADVDAWPAAETAAPHADVWLSARQFRVRDDAVAAANAGQMDGWFGGAPRWEQYPQWPRCDSCRRRMVFLGQINSGQAYFGFFCPDCLTSNVRTQYD